MSDTESVTLIVAAAESDAVTAKREIVRVVLGPNAGPPGPPGSDGGSPVDPARLLPASAADGQTVRRVSGAWVAHSWPEGGPGGTVVGEPIDLTADPGPSIDVDLTGIAENIGSQGVLLASTVTEVNLLLPTPTSVDRDLVVPILGPTLFSVSVPLGPVANGAQGVCIVELRTTDLGFGLGWAPGDYGRTIPADLVEGLGNAAVRNVGTGSLEVAAGDHTHPDYVPDSREIAGLDLAVNRSAADLRGALGSGTPSGTNYLRGDGTWATPASGSGDGPAPWRSGLWTLNWPNEFNTGNSWAFGANLAIAVPVRWAPGRPITGLGLRVVTAIASSGLYGGIYLPGSDGQPGAAILNPATLLDTSSTGAKTVTGLGPATPTTSMGWAVIQTTHAGVVTLGLTTSSTVTLGRGDPSQGPYTCLQMSRTAAALPSDLSGSTWSPQSVTGHGLMIQHGV